MQILQKSLLTELKNLFVRKRNLIAKNTIINIIIFSKDRACQLELLLRSLKEYWPESFAQNINILYTYSNKEYQKSYEILKEEYNDVTFTKENTFKLDLLGIIEKFEFTVFFVDDDIFIESFSLYENEINQLRTNKEILCLSLRLHPRQNYCYALNISVPQINKTIWKWQEQIGDYNYPMSLDGHIFRTDEIKELLLKLEYHSPNTLESALANNPIKLPYLMCFDKAKIINNPCNIVQSTHLNRHGDIDSEELNRKFLLGERISLENITGTEYPSCHHEIPLILKHNSIIRK